MKRLALIIVCFLFTVGTANAAPMPQFWGYDLEALGSDLIPATDDTYDLGEGTTPLEWKDLYIDGVAYIDTLNADTGVITGSTTPLLDLNPSGAGAKEVISIVPSGAIGAVHWDGISIDGSALDPSASGASIHGIHVDFSGVAQPNDPELRGIYITQPATYSGQEGRAAFRATGNALSVSMLGREGYALRVDGGMHHDYTAGSGAGAAYTVHDIIINAALLAATSEVTGYQVQSANGAPAGSMVGMTTLSHVDPVHQHIGTFASPGANLACRLTSGPTYTDVIDAQILWVADDDAILIGHASATFNQIKFAWTTPATKDVFITWYYYSSVGSTWVQFFPNDTAIDGGRQDGVVFWDSDDIPNWTTHDPDAGGAATTTGYYVQARRTRVSDPGPVVLLTAEILSSTDYTWDKDGQLEIANLGVNTLTPAGTLHTVLEAGKPAIFGGDTLATVTGVSGTDASPTVLTVATTNGIAIGDAVIVNLGTNATVGTYWCTAVTVDTSVTLDRNASSGGAISAASVTYVNDPIVIETGSGSGEPRIVLPSQNDSVTPTWAFGAGKDGIYHSGEGILRFSIAGVNQMNMHNLGFYVANGAKIQNEGATATNPVFLPYSGDEGTGLGRAGDNQLSLIAGVVEGQRIMEVNSVIYNLFGVTEQDSVTDATTNGTTTITKADENFLTTCQIGDAVLMWGGTTTADYGLYYIVTVSNDTTLILNSAPSGSVSDMDFYVLRGGIITSAGLILATGNIVAGQESITCASDACVEDITKQIHFIISEAGAEVNADTLTLDDGINIGQEATFIFKTESDVGDTIIIDTAQQVGWGNFTMDAVGDSITFIWDGTNWTIKCYYLGTVG